MFPGSGIVAAIATAPGKGGIGIVRISGSDLRSLCTAIVGGVPEPRHATRARFIDAKGELLDDGLALYFPAPHSYTGEDTLELHGHGGPVVLGMLLERCLELGARPAQPGEFTRRAFLNDKLDLAQAEAVADLIDAATQTSARCALRSLNGEFSRIIRSLVDQLIELRMLVEASLDFPEEEIEAADKADARGRLERLTAQTEQAIDQGRRGSLLRTGLNVVIAGRPNMGKSSLINALAGEDLAIVTAIPGTTRDAIRQTIQIEGVPFNITDTAGLRETADEIEGLGIRRTWDMLEKADLILLVVEAGAGLTTADETILAEVPGNAARIVVHNKLDLTGHAPTWQTDTMLWQVHTSAKTGAGLDLLKRALLEAAGWRAGDEDVFMARVRHLDALSLAADHFRRAKQDLHRLELIAEELRLAQTALGTITGEYCADDLLGDIFSRFCIGK